MSEEVRVREIREMKIQIGALILISEGEYSDYRILDTFRALKDFDTGDVIREFMAKEYPDFSTDEYWDSPRPECEDLQKWVLSVGYVEELKTVEWYVGTYGRFDTH